MKGVKSGMGKCNKTSNLKTIVWREFLTAKFFDDSLLHPMNATADPLPLTYARYLKIDDLLQLQQPLSDGPEHDELLFIIIHQVYELWFKEMIHETILLRHSLENNQQPRARATLRRMLTILKTLVAQVDVLETITPISFESFRDRLESASGFQSAQFRELEFILGKKSKSRLEHHPQGSAGREKLQQRWREPTIYDAFIKMLSMAGHQVGEEALNRDVTQPLQEWPQVQEVLIKVYRTDPQLSQICELLVDLDEGIQEWRYRHVKMVERTIGFKKGTGGSSGAAYLRETLFAPLYPDLWAIRTAL